MDEEKVFIGKMVHYRETEGGVVAAVVVQVHTNDCVNLKCFSDDTRGTYFLTSVARGSGVSQFQDVDYEEAEAPVAVEEAAGVDEGEDACADEGANTAGEHEAPGR